MKALLITAENYDDLEALYPYYRLIEAGFEVDVASFQVGEVLGKKHCKIEANFSVDNIDCSLYDCLVLPGGMAAENLRQNDNVKNIAKYFFEKNLPVASICHGQQILISAGVLKGRKATCYPGIKDDLINAGAYYENKEVVVDGNLVTSRRPEDLPYFMREFIDLFK